MQETKIMNFDIRTVKNDNATEIYISATGEKRLPLSQQAEKLFSGVAEILNENNARIFQERIFTTAGTPQAIRDIRSQQYGDLDDGVEPAWLMIAQGAKGPIAGLQIHAIAGIEDSQIVKEGDTPCGRTCKFGEVKLTGISAITAPAAGDASQQTNEMLQKCENVLKQNGTDLQAVPRTWMWLKGILDWYDDFNTVRNAFFIERGMIGKGIVSKMPASTGIGIGPENGICAIDLVAVNDPGLLEYIDAGGNQKSAYEYGSAFSRACIAPTPAGKTLYISGTASIDAAGNTTNLDDAEKQIEDTIENIRAVLRDGRCTDADLVAAIMYCKTREVENIFLEKFYDLGWPAFTAVADVCRDNLLFEIEAAAILPAE
jgi:enamine deaminase RidA (YjgF/YER057c/UK114 family)